MDSYSGLKFEETGLSRENPVKFFTRTFETERVVRLHYHSSLEINICRGVNGVIRFGESSIDLCEDCLIMLPPETPHSYRFSACSGTVEVCHIMLDAFPGAAEAVGGHLGLKIFPLDDCPDAVSHLYSMSEALVMAEQYGHLLLFVSAFADKGNNSPATGNGFLRTVIDYAEKHYSQKISLEDISSAAGISRYHFSRKFKEHTGDTWTSYLLGVRLAVAKRLLRDGSGVGEAAGACGFESDSYFIKCFKNEFGLTPLKWAAK